MTKERVFELLNKAILHIGENFNAEEKEYFLDEPLRKANLPFEWSTDSGISKAVILIKGADFVIKMPFFKIYDDDSFNSACADWSYNRSCALKQFLEKRQKEENSDTYSLSQEETIDFYEKWEKENPEPDENEEEYFYYDIEGASNIDLGVNSEPTIPDWDYCRLESIIYQLAVEEGLGAYFAEEGYLGTIDQTPVYYQVRCTPMSEMVIDYNSAEYEKKSNKSRKICENLKADCFNAFWISDFIDMYGEEEFKRFNNFLERYEIGDLRTCNIGYLDDAPILFDYSSYRDW